MKSKLTRIKSGIMSRGMALAKVSVTAGAKAASHAIGGIFTDEADREDRLKGYLLSQMQLIANELGELKGSLQKVGQMLSLYGERLLPPEANAVLKSLQSQSPPLEWQAIEKVLRAELGEEKLAELEIEHEPLAAASLGQVHRATEKATGQKLAIKIQYPGVDAAIDSDLKSIRSLFSLTKMLPKGYQYDELFREVREMLHREVDYTLELKSTEEFKARLGGDSRYRIAEVAPRFSSRRILTTSFEEGVALDSPEVLALSQERRNALGIAFMELFFREVFEWGVIQTDPHFGNYRVKLSSDGDQLVLLDFGAIRKLPETFLKPYRKMVQGAVNRNRKQVESAATALGFLADGDAPELLEKFDELCFMITEPFAEEEVYDWGASDLHLRAMKAGKSLALQFKLRPPPREVVFLDRKMAGVFFVLSTLKAQVTSRETITRFLERRV